MFGRLSWVYDARNGRRMRSSGPGRPGCLCSKVRCHAKSDGFRTGNDGFRTGNDGFRTESDGFRTENDGFRTGNDGFRTENDGFRTENVLKRMDFVLKMMDFVLKMLGFLCSKGGWEVRFQVKNGDFKLKMAILYSRNDDFMMKRWQPGGAGATGGGWGLGGWLIMDRHQFIMYSEFNHFWQCIHAE